jgi:transposase-like protein
VEQKRLEELIEEHYSIRNVAKAVGVSATTIRYWLRHWNLKSKGRGPKRACRNCGAFVRRAPNVYCSSACQWRFNRRIKVEKDPDEADARLLKRYLFDCRECKCEVCGIMQWMGKPAPLELDHKDGNSANNQLNNLRLICPNCHAQSDTYKGKNKGKGRYSRRERYAQGKSY